MGHLALWEGENNPSELEKGRLVKADNTMSVPLTVCANMAVGRFQEPVRTFELCMLIRDIVYTSCCGTYIMGSKKPMIPSHKA